MRNQVQIPYVVCFGIWLTTAWPLTARAEVLRFEVSERKPYANGRAFGERGTYEQVRGKVYFALDPTQDANRQIVDLEFAPKAGSGKVEFSADFEILAPADLSKSNGAALYDVNNRGNRTCLGLFNVGGDEFLMRHGFVIVSSGWIAELLPRDDRLRLTAPIATDGGRPIVGMVRAEMAPNRAAETLTISHWENMGSYEPTAQGLERASLTWRLREKGPRVPIPREQWTLIRTDVYENGERSQLPRLELRLAGGFEPGYLYEFIYEAQDPLVQGTGLAGIRDLVSCLKYDTTSRNPLRLPDGAPAIHRAHAFGISQSGRCLRMFLYDGFNADEEGRQVFDGVMPHVAGAGLGFFNHRFASPTRHNAQHDNHLYPVDMFPFTYGDEQDPYTQRSDGILRRARATRTVPKIVHTQTSAEYWNRSASLAHTDPLAQRDSELPSEVRIYAFGGAQHGPGTGNPGARDSGQLPGNPTDYRPLLRALLIALDAWVRDGREPPPSVYPLLSEHTLVGWRAAESGWRPLPGVRYPEVIQQPEFLDHGPDFLTLRRISLLPPVSRGQYTVTIPAYGPDDNELGMLKLPSVAVPVATYTGWNLRHRSIGAETELLALAGGYIPFSRTIVEAHAQGDPRPALLARYRDFGDYQQQFLAAATALVERGYLLDEEIPRLKESVLRLRALFEK